MRVEQGREIGKGITGRAVATNLTRAMRADYVRKRYSTRTVSEPHLL